MIKTNRIFFLSLVTMLLIPTISVSGSPQQGALIALDDLEPTDQRALMEGIQQAHKEYPEAFTAIQTVYYQLPQLDENKRGRLPVITPMLKSVGQKTLFPLLERIAVQDPGQDGLSDTAWLAWRIALLETVGMQRDNKAGPVLYAVLISDQDESLVMETAAIAYAKLGTDRVMNDLLHLLSSNESKKIAIMTGMGYCRRHAMAVKLADILLGKCDQKTAEIAARSLGRIGSAWAWQTDIIAQSGEELPTRTTAALALITAFPKFNKGIQKIISQAILLVNHHETLTYIEEMLKKTTPDKHSELEQLKQSYIQNPLHKKIPKK